MSTTRTAVTVTLQFRPAGGRRIEGVLRAEDGAESEFSGWLELIRILQDRCDFEEQDA